MLRFDDYGLKVRIMVRCKRSSLKANLDKANRSFLHYVRRMTIFFSANSFCHSPKKGFIGSEIAVEGAPVHYLRNPEARPIAAMAPIGYRDQQTSTSISIRINKREEECSEVL